MTTATGLATDMSGWMPTTRHYQVDGGHLAITVANFLTAQGTSVYLADEHGCAVSTEAITAFPDGTTHTEALQNLGYTVIDTIIDVSPAVPEPDPVAVEQSVIDMLPPQIAAMINAATEGAQ